MKGIDSTVVVESLEKQNGWRFRNQRGACADADSQAVAEGAPIGAASEEAFHVSVLLSTEVSSAFLVVHCPATLLCCSDGLIKLTEHLYIVKGRTRV